jgi:hypothetical protein
MRFSVIEEVVGVTMKTTVGCNVAVAPPRP